MDYRVISIGTLTTHELWENDTQPRTPHATTTLIRSGKAAILVDPGLPGPVIAARLKERSGLDASAITHVFLTNFMLDHRWGLAAFEQAQWWIHEPEREFVGRQLVERFQHEQDPQAKELLKQEIAVLKRCQPAPDRLAPQVDLFPLPGYTPGTCGLLLSHANYTTLVAGDAVATTEHLEQGRALKGCYDPDQARESFVEAVEIADVLIPGHDNLLLNPTRRAF